MGHARDYAFAEENRFLLWQPGEPDFTMVSLQTINRRRGRQLIEMEGM